MLAISTPYFNPFKMVADGQKILVGPLLGYDQTLLDFFKTGVGLGEKTDQSVSHFAEKDPDHHVQLPHAA